MKIDNIPTSIDPTLNLEEIRDECLKLVKTRAYFSAGAAVVPVPFFDVVIDVGILSQLIPEISARFGLAPEHIRVYDPATKQFIGKNYVNVVLSFLGSLLHVQLLKNPLIMLLQNILQNKLQNLFLLAGK